MIQFYSQFFTKRNQIKHLFLCILLLFIQPLIAQTAPEIASQMTIGWNHGNSMEVPDGETAWGNAAATQQLIDGVKAAGFNTVRIPCAWNSYANQSTYEIDATWLARVKEVVDYCYNNDMYVIINSHWDGGWLEEHPLYSHQAEVNEKHYSFWTQISNYFSGYDEHLLFAGTNEVRADYNEPTSEHIDVQESYNQTFIDAVRATGGNNSNRTLIIQTYNTNIWHGLNYLTLPNDPSNNRLMVEVHHYDSYDFTINADASVCPKWDEGNCSWANTSYVEDAFSQVQQRWVNNGIPVLMGEYGARKKDGGDESEREEFLEFTTDAAKRHGIIPVYWDNGYDNEFGLFNRSNGNVTNQGAIDALMAGAGVDPNSGGGTTYYRIQNQGTGLFIDSMGRTANGDICGQWANTTHVNAQWEFLDTDNGFFRIKNRGTGMYLDGYGKSGNGSNANLHSNTTHYNAQWERIGSSEYFRLRNRATGMYLDGMGRTTNGNNLGQYGGTNHQNAHWRLVTVTSGKQIIENNKTEETIPSTIYPNPVKNVLHISIGENKGSKVDIYNLSGQLILSTELQDENNNIDVSQFSKGIYFVQLKHNNQTETRQLIKK